MVVGGTVDRPTLGLWDPQRGSVDLRDCALHSAGIVAALPVLAGFVTRAALAPYDVPTRSGELKHVLVTESPAGELMVRWVLRSTEAATRVRKHLPWLLAVLPNLRVVTLNIQPAHAALLEGERELVMTERDSLPMEVNGLTLHLGPRSFFQTNTDVAAALYRTARSWVDELAPTTVHDLYCGVGGFALHLAAPDRRVTGIEISADAVAAAERGRDDAGLGPDSVRFVAGDATSHLLEEPRRPGRRQPAAARPRPRARPCGSRRPAPQRSSTPAATRRRSPATWPCWRRTSRCARRCSTCSRRPRTWRCWCCLQR